MSLLIINTLPPKSPEVEQAIASLPSGSAERKVIHTEELNIKPCIGCNACWLITPGRCAVKDDYEQILKAYLQYDAVIFFSGTALGFVDHKTKNVIDRILPLATMYTCFVDGQMRHVPRYDKTFRFGLLYSGEADGEYLNRWLQRVAINMHGTSMGAYPIDRSEEVLSCIS